MVSILLSATLSFRITRLSAINFELMWGSFIYFPKAWRMASCSVTPSSYSFFFSGQSYLRWEWVRKNNTIPDQVTMWNNLPSHSISRIELYPRVTMYLKKDSWFVSYSWFLIATYHHRWLQFSDWFWIRTVKREREREEEWGSVIKTRDDRIFRIFIPWRTGVSLQSSQAYNSQIRMNK